MGSALRDQFPFTSLQSKQSLCETTAIVNHTGSSGTASPFSEGIALDRMRGEKRVCFVAFFFSLCFSGDIILALFRAQQVHMPSRCSILGFQGFMWVGNSTMSIVQQFSKL